MEKLDCGISRIGQFTCLQFLGSGAQGQVMLAKKYKGSLVALKKLPEPILQDFVDDWKNKRN
jgi:hypothetical protein